MYRTNTGKVHSNIINLIKQSFMAPTEVFMIPDNRGSNNSTMDPNLLLASMMNGGGFGGGNNWMWIIFLFFLEPLMRNGWFGNQNGQGGFGGFSGLTNTIDNTAGRELLMQAINNNNSAIRDLANMFNVSTDAIQQAICGLNNSISQLSGQVGITAQQTINAIQQGNMQLASQLASCCCDIRTAVINGNYENRIATLQQTQTLSGDINTVRNVVTQGFCDTAYAFRDQTCQLGSAIKDSTQTIKDTTTAQTNAIISKLDSMERNGLMDKIDALREANSNLKTSANIREQNYATQQMIGAAVAPIAAQLAEIKCAQPNTVTVPYYPFSVQPNCGCGNNNYNNGCGSCQNQFWY